MKWIIKNKAKQKVEYFSLNLVTFMLLLTEYFYFFNWDWCLEAIFGGILIKCNRKMSEETKVYIYKYFL